MATYADIKTDSPWRWGPIVGGPLAFVLLGIGLTLRGWSGIHTVIAVAVTVTSGLIWYSRKQVGAWDSYGIAAERARESGCIRVNSRPRLAFAMLALGIALIATSVCAWFVRTGNFEYPSATLRFLRTPGGFGTGMILVMNGWYRPWDLKVVERGTSE